MTESTKEVRLTQYSHGAGCGCKISPALLDTILGNVKGNGVRFKDLMVGNEEKDDAAVMDLGDGTAIISTTDFFMPIVDDPELFGRIAAVNAISDIYAMGGTPMMAVAILGWPVDKLSPELAGRVVQGAQMACHDAGIPLAGGHSIDSPEPIFGLAVTGRVAIANIKKNGGARQGDILFLTKPLGIGIMTTAQKKGLLAPKHEEQSIRVMSSLNKAGEALGKMEAVSAMTDVTGFGLAGHLIEMCEASGTSAQIRYEDIPIIDPVIMEYIQNDCIPGGTIRNFKSYGSGLKMRNEYYRFLVCDPQTSGGLLIAVSPEASDGVQKLLAENGLWSKPIGRMISKEEFQIEIS